jgi:hypothetical protein
MASSASLAITEDTVGWVASWALLAPEAPMLQQTTNANVTRMIMAANAAVERRRVALSSAQQAHNEMARLLRARDDV